MSEEMTNPEPEVVEEVSEEFEVENEDLSTDEYDDEGGDPELDADDDSEDLEFNGEKYRLPKKISEAVKLMQKDYTTKTQAVAEQRKAAESEYKFRQENIQEIAKVVSLDEQINQYKDLDWSKISIEDPSLFQQLRLQYDDLKDSRQNIAGQLAQKYQHETLAKQHEYAKQLQESESVLRREIKGWSSELELDLQGYAVKEFGFDQGDVVRSKLDPRLYKLLYKAYVGDQLAKKQFGKPKTAPANPVTTLSAKGATVSKDPTKMNDAEFAAWRRRQIKARGS